MIRVEVIALSIRTFLFRNFNIFNFRIYIFHVVVYLSELLFKTCQRAKEFSADAVLLIPFALRESSFKFLEGFLFGYVNSLGVFHIVNS